MGLLVLSIFFCELVGVIGSFFSFSRVPTWYAGLVKPPLNPPNWVFGPVWTMLYALMGIALYFLVRQGMRSGATKGALGFFVAQLIANGLWSGIFFGAQSPFYALVNILVLWLLIVSTIVLSYRVSRVAAYLLLPYIGWVSFAVYLNYMIYVLN